MRRDPTEFGALRVSRGNRHTARFTQAINGAIQSASESRISAVLDEAFAEYSRIDPGAARADEPLTSRGNRAQADSKRAGSNNRRSVTRELVADITSQLDVLDRHREHLARLLQSVEMGPIGD